MAMKKLVKSQDEVRGELLEALKRVSDEKNIPLEALVASIEGALVSAYKKAYGGTGAVRVSADFASNDFRVWAQKLVVQSVANPNTEVAWREARVDNPGINLGDTVEKEVTPTGFGRIAAQTAKQVLLQKLREAERVQLVSEYADKSGQMFRGTVQRMERGNVVVALGKAEAILPRREQVQGEHYRFGDSLYVYVVDIRDGVRGPSITVSRTHPGLVRQMFTLEVPEIGDGIVELKAVAREAGQRTKIAVAANNPDVDPVGACVGPRGLRVGKVVGELGNEKVDIVRWSADPITFISNALSPAQIAKVMLAEEPSNGEAQGTATVIVAEDQQSLAIGKQGQNVRLAAKLTNWRIDIRTEKQHAEEQAKKMFDLNGDAAPTPVTTRVSPDEHAGLFAVDAAADGNAATNGAATSESASNAGSEAAGQATEESVPADLLQSDAADDAPDDASGDEAAQATDAGTASPLADVELPGATFTIDAPDGGASSDGTPIDGDAAANGNGAATGEVSSVAPADSVNA